MALYLEHTPTYSVNMNSVSVLCRLKPAEDSDTNDFIVIDDENSNTLVVDPNKKTEKGAERLLFAFDHVVPAKASQDDVFVVVKPIVYEALMGYNSTIFTYGQTGSGKMFMNGPNCLITTHMPSDMTFMYSHESPGKTFTMHGVSSEGESGRGVVPRVMEVVFAAVREEAASGTAKLELAVSCLEIYQEKLFDLLQEDSKVAGAAHMSTGNSNLRIRQRQSGEVWVEVSE